MSTHSVAPIDDGGGSHTVCAGGVTAELAESPQPLPILVMAGNDKEIDEHVEKEAEKDVEHDIKSDDAASDPPQLDGDESTRVSSIHPAAAIELTPLAQPKPSITMNPPPAPTHPSPPQPVTRSVTVSPAATGPATLDTIIEEEPDAAQPHSRIQLVSLILWVGVLFVYVALGFYMTSLIYPVWQENENDSNGLTVDRVKGKDLPQYILLSIGCLSGLIGAGGITGRIFGIAYFRPWVKVFSMALTVTMGACGYIAVRVYPDPDMILHPNARFGAGRDYANDAFTYTCIGIGCLFAHEILVRIVQRARTRRHLAKAARDRLNLLRLESIDVIHALQAQATALHLTAEGERKEKPRGPRQLFEDEPEHTRPNVSDAGGEDMHLQYLVEKLLRDKDRLTSGQLDVLFSLIVFFYLIQAGGLAYAALEGWDLRTGIEFAVVTVATIGYGDTCAKTTLGRALLFIYFPVGFGVMSYTISLLWTKLFKHAEVYFDTFVRMVGVWGCRTCRQRRWAKRRNQLAEAERRRHEELNKVRRDQQRGVEATTQYDDGAIDPRNSTGQRSAVGLVHHHHLHGSTTRDLAVLGPMESASLDADAFRMREEDAEEARRIEAEWKELYGEEADESRQGVDAIMSQTNRKLLLAFGLVVGIILGGAIIFQYYETSWTYFEAVYFCFVTLTTIGFGDFSPSVPETKIFIIYYVMVGLGALAFVLSLINDKINRKMELLSGKSVPDPSVLSADDTSLFSLGLDPTRLKSLSRLPTWNERFLATQFELEQLQTLVEQLYRTKHVPSQAIVTHIKAITTNMANLAITIGQRQTDEKRMKEESINSHTSLAGDVEDELDLSLYGITNPRLTAASALAAAARPAPDAAVTSSTHPHSHDHPVPPQGKKTAKIVKPIRRTNQPQTDDTSSKETKHKSTPSFFAQRR